MSGFVAESEKFGTQLSMDSMSSGESEIHSSRERNCIQQSNEYVLFGVLGLVFKNKSGYYI